MKRRIVLALMVLVTAWSVWSFAQAPARPQPPAQGPSRLQPMIPPGRPGQPPPGMGGFRPGQPPPPNMGGFRPGQPPPGMGGLRPGQPPFPGAVPPPPPRREGAVEGPGTKEEKKEEEDESAPPADINWVDFGRETPPYLAMVINFGILIAAYYMLGKKPIAAGLKSRRDSIAHEIEEAQKMRKEAEKRATVYQAKLEKLEDEMTTTREALVRAGEAERERIVAEAEAKAERMRKDAEFMVEQELKQLRVDLQRETVETAIAAAEELLRKRVTPADQERVAEDYLADLGRAPAARSVS